MSPIQPYDYYVVLDFEATCDDANPPVPQEIIEFPSVLLSASTLEVIDEFSTFVRPVHHPKLSEFCMDLTGITQAEVADAPLFRAVLDQHAAWLESHGLTFSTARTKGNAGLVLCGDWDLRKMLPEQFAAADPPVEFVHPAYREWINIKQYYLQETGEPKAPGMVGMLRKFDLELEGRHHRGIDDCRNITKLVRTLIERGQVLDATTKLSASRYPPIRIELEMNGQTEQLTLKKRAIKSLMGVAGQTFRTQIAGIQTPDGQSIESDEDLFDLCPETRLLVTSA